MASISLTRTAACAAEDAGTAYRQIESLRRGLEILRCMNQAPGGRASITAISQRTGLHRTTVRRMLDTLQTEGYVRRSPADEQYCLNQKVRQLSDGFTAEDWVAQIAAPAMGALLQQAVWPSDLCVLDGDGMRVCESTHRFSPLSFHRAMIRQRMPILFTATGRAYLGACPPAEREEILAWLRQGQDAQSQLARHPGLVAALLRQTREQGFGANDGDWQAQSHMSAIALPVCQGARVLGSLNVIFTKKAMTTQQAAQRLLPMLQAAVQDIESQLNPTTAVVAASASSTTASRWPARNVGPSDARPMHQGV